VVIWGVAPPPYLQLVLGRLVRGRLVPMSYKRMAHDLGVG